MVCGIRLIGVVAAFVTVVIMNCGITGAVTVFVSVMVCGTRLFVSVAVIVVVTVMGFMQAANNKQGRSMLAINNLFNLAF